MIIDLHTHPKHFVPQPFRAMWKGVTPLRPRDVGFDQLVAAGVDAVVAKAVGDPIVTRCYVRLSPSEAVDTQLALIEAEAAAGGAVVVRSSDELADAFTRRQPAVMLGIEGADALSGDVDGVDRWYERGVRAVVLVHLSDNDLGTTCLPWQKYAGPLPVRRRMDSGLTPFGARVVAKMNAVGMVVDVAHADRDTMLAVIDCATAPVVSSHSGARAVEDFARYLADDELRAIASTGGVIGLWPYRGLRHGVRTVSGLVAHARHIADIAAVDHIAIGTDMNGVPGVMAGYGGEGDLGVVTAALRAGGFTADEVAAVVGGNALRVLRAVEAAAR